MNMKTGKQILMWKDVYKILNIFGKRIGTSDLILDVICV
jgi:hypothetical protein